MRYSYAFTNDHGLSPEDVQNVLASMGLAQAEWQVLHYTQPRVVLVFVSRELSGTEREELQRAIASIQGTDPIPPP